MNRRGIALLTTVGLILILSLLVLKSVTISQKYFTRLNEINISTQLNKTFLDILKILQENTKDIKDKDSLSIIIGLPIMISDENINAFVDISSAAGVININKLLNQNETNSFFYNLLQSALYEYHVTNSNFFLQILLDAIDKDRNQRAYMSEAALDSELFEDGGIYSWEAFNFLLDHYVANGGDAAIYEVPWKDLIGFYGDKVDFNYIKEPLLKLIEKEYNFTYHAELGSISGIDDLNLSNDARVAFDKLGIDVGVLSVICAVNLSYLDEQKTFSFMYDITTKKVSYIETVF
ncbi:MAG: hypothetical protein LBQ18_05320 [Campylobacteraceae bacterium]|jgi:hypothetical protein|nr:hypothetical protein [Campylobacteraceae bacterium]